MGRGGWLQSGTYADLDPVCTTRGTETRPSVDTKPQKTLASRVSFNLESHKLAKLRYGGCS